MVMYDPYNQYQDYGNTSYQDYGNSNSYGGYDQTDPFNQDFQSAWNSFDQYQPQSPYDPYNGMSDYSNGYGSFNSGSFSDMYGSGPGYDWNVQPDPYNSYYSDPYGSYNQVNYDDPYGEQTNPTYMDWQDQQPQLQSYDNTSNNQPQSPTSYGDQGFDTQTYAEPPKPPWLQNAESGDSFKSWHGFGNNPLPYLSAQQYNSMDPSELEGYMALVPPWMQRDWVQNMQKSFIPGRAKRQSYLGF